MIRKLVITWLSLVIVRLITGEPLRTFRMMEKIWTKRTKIKSHLEFNITWYIIMWSDLAARGKWGANPIIRHSISIKTDGDILWDSALQRLWVSANPWGPCHRITICKRSSFHPKLPAMSINTLQPVSSWTSRDRTDPFRDQLAYWFWLLEPLHMNKNSQLALMIPVVFLS